jgi:hypothetical protein
MRAYYAAKASLVGTDVEIGCTQKHALSGLLFIEHCVHWVMPRVVTVLLAPNSLHFFTFCNALF